MCFHKIFTTKTKLLPVVLQTITVHYVYWLAYRIVYYSCIQQYSYYKYSPKISCFKPRVEEFFHFFIFNDYEGSNLERNIIDVKQNITNPLQAGPHQPHQNTHLLEKILCKRVWIWHYSFLDFEMLTWTCRPFLSYFLDFFCPWWLDFDQNIMWKLLKLFTYAYFGRQVQVSVSKSRKL